jgi:hypothetical protein
MLFVKRNFLQKKIKYQLISQSVIGSPSRGIKVTMTILLVKRALSTRHCGDGFLLWQVLASSDLGLRPAGGIVLSQLGEWRCAVKQLDKWPGLLPVYAVMAGSFANWLNFS